ncbi:GNAT family N-acetyltransferase [Streptomyces regalis]|uniref:GNAT family N-acetyltransferase n=1 Tax=Streptomyces regalis TaxID=68262 RepID=UPI0007C65FC3|nr:GNAT family N-acetyltransferase [Streptomyces regalis]
MHKLSAPIRPYRETDNCTVLALIDADRLPGQPACTPGMLEHALDGRSPIDSRWWEELQPPRTNVLLDGEGLLTGAVSYAIRPRDEAGLLLWMHCREDHAAAGALLRHALDQLGPRTNFAFECASALTFGVEGLSARHRATTREVLQRAGFTTRDLRRYIQSPLPLTGLPLMAAYSTGPVHKPPGRRLQVRDGDEVVAEAVIGNPFDGIAVLRWLHVTSSAQRQGMGRALLGSAVDLLAGLGATQVIGYVDDDDPRDPERDRTAANALYDSVGFTEVDRLLSFTRLPE